MGHRLSKIYTRTGDSGTTGLGDGSRIEKDSLRVEAYGTIDELNSQIGLVIAFGIDDAIAHQLLDIQHDLFDLGSELCVPGYSAINDTNIDTLEKILDDHNADLPALKEFILPGGNLAAATCHVARTVCRRAERIAVSLAREENINPPVVKYLNRLSDLLFVLCRVLARQDGQNEVLWDKNRRQPQGTNE
ncbi:MAG TPA: cob(I)yrinic acid a,c-diamide adenosyltransferase [Cycloclasticus sp.]|jgi:cob(I)alamin adenosyltransferase|nr:cob(I)yrinic acid a,c-diamide adenosyltransferase [Cycloclasticus sp.]HIL93009.1 cob(I)yrinic acid a,c-diamide adenosyltransferase [Cycloclasticus sp.]